jgi:hypothetical protein
VTDPKSYINWLNDPVMLPKVVPNARIMRYGYKSMWCGADAIRQNSSLVAHRLLLALRRERKVKQHSSPTILSPLLRRKLVGISFPTAYFSRPLFRRASSTEGQRHISHACPDVRTTRLIETYRHFWKLITTPRNGKASSSLRQA